MGIKNDIINRYIIDNNLPNAKIIDSKDSSLFDYYPLDNIPAGIGLADTIFLNEKNELIYGFLKDNKEEEMQLCIGYTGSGKSQRLVLQQAKVAIERGHSCLITDTSGQLIDYLYDYLKLKNVNIRIINFGNTDKSDRYNPFYNEALKVKKFKKVFSSTEQICEDFSKLVVSGTTTDPSWSNGARSLVNGLVLSFFEDVASGMIEPEDVTIYNVVKSFHWLMEEVTKNSSIADLGSMDYYKDKDSFCSSIQHIAPIAQNADTTRAGYFGVAADYVNEIENEIIYEITSSNTFDISELWTKQTVIFINTADKSIGDMITSILVNDLYERAIDESSKSVTKRLPRVIHLFLDEFANIQFTDNKQFELMLTTTRKMQIFFNMYIQSYSQLITKFGEATTTTILANCTQVFLGTRDYESRSKFAMSCGKKTIESFDSYCGSGHPGLVQVDVLNPEQLGLMKKGEMYILRQGYDVIKTYFEAAYKCKDFIPTKTYIEKFKSNKYDYENKIMIQPLIVKKVNVKKLNERNLTDYISRRELEEYENIINNNTYSSFILMKKFERLGLIKQLGKKYIGLIDPLVIEKFKTRRKSIFDDF